ncbi:MAG TPA: hypothetical protein VHL53_05520 [Acidimicrobiia bacterium]|nr:hypothetical protein [Acidimicrobiia bacterium]
MAGYEIILDENGSNGAAYLVHMLLTQQAEADDSGRFAATARRLQPVKLELTDTGESCVVAGGPDGLKVTGGSNGQGYANVIRAESHHVLDVTQLRLAGQHLITGPLKAEQFQTVVKDMAARRLRIGGLFRHYGNAMRFLWLVNVRGK